jgi:hypothetical protein
MKTILSVLVILACVPCSVFGQDRSVDPTKVLAPYVNESTYLIGVVDLQNVGIEAILERFTKVGMTREQVAQLKQVAVQTRDNLVRAGGRFVCFTASLDDMQAIEPLLVIPISQGGKAQAVADLLDKLGIKVQIKGDTVLAGKPNIVERALARKPAAVPELTKALAAVEAMPSRLALTMPLTLRKSLEELMPNLPKELGGGPIVTLTRGLSWGAAGVDLAVDRQQLRAIVQAKDAATAMEVDRLANRALGLAAEKDLPGAQAIRPQVKNDQLHITLDAKALDAVVLPAVARVREAADRTESSNNLKQLALAMHNYNDVFKSLPAQASYDQKKPLLSWRVHLLPYLGEQEVYKQFKLDEPWDSAHNKPLIDKMPALFRSPHIMNAERGKTTYLVPTGKELIFDGPKKTKMAQITDGTSNTILIVEADESRAVWWTQPADYAVDRKNPKAGLLRPDGHGFLTAFADGSVRFIAGSIADETLWLYFNPSDGMSIPD